MTAFFEFAEVKTISMRSEGVALTTENMPSTHTIGPDGQSIRRCRNTLGDFCGTCIYQPRCLTDPTAWPFSEGAPG